MDTAVHPLKIFIVENHEDTLTYLRRYLEQQGHEVLCAKDMRTAIEALKSLSIDVLISDIGLPDGDGWELMRTLSKSRPAPFGIAMSGFGTRSDSEKSRAAGYRHHLNKPFLPEDIDTMLEEAAKERFLSPQA